MNIGAPSRDARDGPLVPFLLLLTVVTGLVDAVSYLGLGRVFVANMTGNIVFLGFAMTSGSGFTAAPSLIALGGFLLGALGGGRLANAASHRGRLLAVAASWKIGLVVVATVLAAEGGALAASANAVIFLLGAAMGVQNASVRRLAVPDLTTTVLTMTLTGLSADSKLAGGSNPRPLRRIVSALAMFGGAAIGAALEVRYGIVPPLALAAAFLAVTSAFAFRSSGSRAPWTRIA